MAVSSWAFSRWIAVDQLAAVFCERLDVFDLGVEGHQPDLVRGACLVDIGLCGLLGGFQLAAVVHAARDVHHQHGGQRADIVCAADICSSFITSPFSRITIWLGLTATGSPLASVTET